MVSHALTMLMPEGLTTTMGLGLKLKWLVASEELIVILPPDPWRIPNIVFVKLMV